MVSTASNTYAYRALMETLLTYGSDATKFSLTSALFYKDTAGKMDVVDPTLDDPQANLGLKKRSQFPAIACRWIWWAWFTPTYSVKSRIHNIHFSRGILVEQCACQGRFRGIWTVSKESFHQSAIGVSVWCGADHAIIQMNIYLTEKRLQKEVDGSALFCSFCVLLMLS